MPRGGPTRRFSFVALTVAVGAGAAALLVPRAAVGTPMLEAAALATALGMMAGFVTAVIYVRSRLGGTPPLATVARVALGVVAGMAVGRFVPGHGKIIGLAATAIGGADLRHRPGRHRRARPRRSRQARSHAAPLGRG